MHLFSSITIRVGREEVYSHSCLYCSKIGDCTTTYYISLLKKFRFGITFQHPFIHLYMGWPLVAFCPLRLFWTRSTKMIHSSGVPESNLGILIMYFPEVVSPGVLWHVSSIYSKATISSFSSLAKGMIVLTNLLGWVLVFLSSCSSISTIFIFVLLIL